MMTVTYLGQEIDVLANDRGGAVSLMLRGPDRATLMTACMALEWVLERVSATVDPETGDITWTKLGEPSLLADGLPATHPGAAVSWIGQIVTVPATFDDLGNEMSAPIMPPEYHINVILFDQQLERMSASTEGERFIDEILALWTELGTPDPTQHAAETGSIWDVVSLLDPDSIATPANVWA